MEMIFSENNVNPNNRLPTHQELNIFIWVQQSRRIAVALKAAGVSRSSYLCDLVAISSYGKQEHVLFFLSLVFNDLYDSCDQLCNRICTMMNIDDTTNVLVSNSDSHSIHSYALWFMT